MANRPESKWENFVKSWNEYVRAQLGATFQDRRAGDLIEYEGVPFDDAGKKEWLSAHLLEPIRPTTGAFRRVSTTVDASLRGQALIVLAQLNVFVRPALQAASVRAFRLHTLRDTVLNVFQEHTLIAVKDYAGDSTTLGNFVVDRINLDRQVTDPAVREELRQHVLGIEMRWLDRWS